MTSLEDELALEERALVSDTEKQLLEGKAVARVWDRSSP